MATTFSGIANRFGVSEVSSHSSSKSKYKEKFGRIIKKLINLESKVISQIENEVNAALCEVHDDVDYIVAVCPEQRVKLRQSVPLNRTLVTPLFVCSC
ncbi:hypothetical protein Glove_21g399 [Diversispora epigaea]|uniref:Uncharacterized protein n=1 Tax=Diversispora epigaea TaxID=1348612 RepID=A0A397JM59_9GLOM|nr:hypothetical protein Glove_21g399 [Diversispora epigaea]